MNVEVSLGKCPCENCGQKIEDHAPSELRRCAEEVESGEQQADALAWWRSQQ